MFVSLDRENPKKISDFQKVFRLLFFFFEKSPPKLKVVLGYFLPSGQNSRFGVFFVFRTKQSFWGIFCRENIAVILEDFLKNLRPFWWLPPKNKNFLKKKVETFFFFFRVWFKKFPQKKSWDLFFRVWSTKIFNQNDLYPQTKIKRRFGVFLESRKSKGHFGVFLEK